MATRGDLLSTGGEDGAIKVFDLNTIDEEFKEGTNVKTFRVTMPKVADEAHNKIRHIETIGDQMVVATSMGSIFCVGEDGANKIYQDEQNRPI